MVLPQDPFSYLNNLRDTVRRTGWWHSFEVPGGLDIEGASTVAAQRMRLAQFPIPEDLRGKRVLDVGTWDGWFAMEMERRGAEVMAIDRFENPHFYEIHDLLKSRVDYRQLSVYDLSPELVGRFDIVLCMGVLYHLKHPLLALERVCSVAKDLVAVESFVLKNHHASGLNVESQPLMKFFENDEFGGEFDNWVAPTVPCLLSFCLTAGFVRVQLNNDHDYGAAVTCYRTWGHIENSMPTKPALELTAVFNTANGGINFSSKSSEEYVTCLVTPAGKGFGADSVWPEVSGYAAGPVFAGLVDGGYRQVNFKLPPGLSSGWNEVRLHTSDGVSNSAEIAVDIPIVTRESVIVESACDGVDWHPWRISLKNGFASLWIRGLPKHADRYNARVSNAGRRKVTNFVGSAKADRVRQLNIRVEGKIPKGQQRLEFCFGPVAAPPVAVDITA